MPDPTGTRLDLRCIWLDSGTIVAMNQALIDADQRGVNERWLTWNLGAVVAAWDAAPANPAQAIEDAMFPADWLDRNEYREASRANALDVLAALGCVVERPANTGDHHA